MLTNRVRSEIEEMSSEITIEVSSSGASSVYLDCTSNLWLACFPGLKNCVCGKSKDHFVQAKTENQNAKRYPS
jgi:hypothetical protein